MKSPNYRQGNGRCLLTTVTCLASLLLPLFFTIASGGTPDLSTAPREMHRLGERMYREGILPQGKPMRAVVKGDLSVPGTTFACVSCHLYSGLGAVDENVYTPPINGGSIFRPLYQVYKGMEQGPNSSHPVLLRPAYTDATLTEAIRSGKDPTGRVLSDVMPRYDLDDRAAMILVDYLKSLSSSFSPGVTDTTIRFGTVITDEVAVEERNAMLTPLKSYFNIMNSQINTFKTPRGARSRLMVENMLGTRDALNKTIALNPWVLKGPAETWRGQLEAYNLKEPVFALLGGITTGDWKPIHQFCEDNHIPCLFPNTKFPVISGQDWYTLYLSKGYYQEGESAARYLSSQGDLMKGKTVVQIVRASREGEALATGFQQTWKELGRQRPVTVSLPPGETLSKNRLMQVLSGKRSTVLIVWDDATALPALESLGDNKGRPDMVFVSSLYLGKHIWELNKSIRDFTYITYPAAFSPYSPTSGMGKQKVPSDLQATLKQADEPLKDDTQKITALTNALTQLWTQTFMDMKGNYYRDYFLDVMGKMMNQQYPLYGQVSFGPSKRYASKGCYIVQLSQGDSPALVKKSDWEIY